MIPHHVSYQLAILGLLWLCVILQDVWPRQNVVSPQPSVQPADVSTLFRTQTLNGF